MSMVQSIRPAPIREERYPLWGLIVVMALNFMAPFITSLLVYPAFLICVYRVIRYDERVFVTDYAALTTISMLFRTSGGMSLMVYLCLFAAVWYFVRSGIRADRSYVMLIILLNYLILRMQFEISNLLLCFGQLFMLCVLLPKQDEESAERTIKTFCISLLVSSAYALLLRNTSQIVAIRGSEVPAFWGSTLMRFQGLFQDPNYYMSLLIVALALLMKLKNSNRIRSWHFWCMGVGFAAFGLLTYSKTFFLMLVLLVGVYVVWQFWDRKFARGVALTFTGAVAAAVLLLADFSPFAVILTRLTNATNLDELTTGRSEVFVAYMNVITENVGSALFGQGLAAQGLQKDPHNLYLEIVYYIGVIGLLLLVCFIGAMTHLMKRKARQTGKQNLFAKYAVLFTVLVLHFALHGMFSIITYACFSLAVLSILLTKKEEVDRPCESC